jgi:glycosyltransferase involved in cell wall biosynthesis
MLRSPVISIVIPAFNEEKTIGNVIEETATVMDSLNMPYEIIVVDDGSTDNTRRVAAAYKATVLSNEKNRGKGYAERKGFQHAQGDIIVTIDGDGAHKPKEISSLITPLLNGTDVAAGSRFLGRGKYRTSKLNFLGNLMFNMSIMLMTGRYVTDSQTGFRAIKKEVLKKLNLESEGYDIETEITVKSLRNGFTFQEQPITVNRREYDTSKLRILSDGAKILKTIIKANLSKINHQPGYNLLNHSTINYRQERTPKMAIEK